MMSAKLPSILVSGLLVLGLAAIAEARPSKGPAKRVAIGSFEGEGGAELQAVITAALGKLGNAQIISSDDWQSAAGRLGVDLGNADGVTRTAADLQVAAIVTGSFGPAGKNWQAIVQVLAGDGGEPAGTFKTKQKTKAKALAEVKKRFAKKLGGVIRAQKVPDPAPPPEAAPTPAPEPPAPVAEPTPRGPKKRVVVLDFEGDRAGELRDFLEKELSSSGDFDMVARADLQRIAKELSLDLEDEEDRAKAATRLELAAFVAGEVEREDRELSIKFEVFQGLDGESVGKGGSSSNRVSSLARVLRRDLAPLLERARAPGQAAVASSSAPAAPPVTRRSEATEESSSARAEAEPEPAAQRSGLRSASPLELAVGFQWGLRNFDYKDDVLGQLRAYEHPGVTALSARLLWYPAAHFTSGFVSNLGADVQFDLGLGLGTETEDGATQFGTSAMSLAASLRARLPLGVHELGLFAGLALDQFSLDGAEAFFPNVSYVALRPGLAGRFWLGDMISLSPHFAWRVVLDAGDVAGADWFPRSSVGGLDAGLIVGIQLVGPLEAQIAGTYRRYFYSMNPEVGDVKVAGGALDQRVTGTFYLAFHLD